MNQDLLLMILRDKGPCTVGMIADMFPDVPYSQMKADITGSMTRLERYGLVKHVGFIKGRRGEAKLWTVDSQM